MSADARSRAYWLWGSAALLLMLSCSLIRPPTTRPTPTPTHSLSAVEATPGGASPSAAASHWHGTVQTTTGADYGSAGSCTGEKWSSTFDIAVNAGGDVTGTGQAHVLAAPKCGGPGAKALKTDATNALFDVFGVFDGRAFRLQFVETSIDGSTAGLFNYALLLRSANVVLDVPITGTGHAQAQIRITRTMPIGAVNAEHNVDMSCADCH